MTPEELAALFKRRGDFDDTRKNLLSDFQNSSVGQQFTRQLSDILQSCIDEDPSLLQRERSEFHQLMVDRISKSTEYKKVQQFVDSLLQPAQYMSKIESTLMTIVKEQAPVVEKEAAQDKDREASSSTSSTAKRSSLHALDSTKKENGEKLEKLASKIPDKRSRLPESLPAKPIQSSPPLPSEASAKKDMDINVDEDDKENVTVQNGSLDTLDANDSPRPKPTLSESPPPRKKGGRSLGLMHIIPKKRNRRQSADSNSSLSSPPSSSEPDSDIDDPTAEGGRAKKVVKKANRGMDSTGETNHGTFGSSLDRTDTLSDLGADSSMDIDPMTGVNPELVEGKDVEITTEQGSLKTKVENEDGTQLELPTADAIIIPKADSQETIVKKEQSSEISGDRPTTKDTSRISTSSSGAATVRDHQKLMPSSSRRKEPESDRSRSSSGSSSHRPGPPLKRTHTPQPLPPRPNIVPLPPKPTIKPSSSLSRRTSHSRNTSATTTSGTVGNPSTHSGSPKSPSSATNTLSAIVGSSSSPSLSSLSNSGHSGIASRHHSFSGRVGDNHHSSHGHQVHPLPPPPHQLQHPLPPTPRPGLTSSRSTPHSLNAKTGQVLSLSKPNISTSPSLHSPPATSSSTTPTTPHSANITSPDPTKSPQEVHKDSKDSKDLKDRFKETEVTKESSPTSSLPRAESSQLKSPGSNSSNDSISSTGSLSTTGSTSGMAELSSQFVMEATSQPLVKALEDVANPKEQSKESEPISASIPPSTNGLKESGPSDNLPSTPGSISTSSPQPTPLGSLREELSSSDNKSGRPRLSSVESSDSQLAHLEVPRSSSLSSVPKSGHSGSVSSPPTHPLPSKSHTLSSSSTSTSVSTSASSGSHKAKPIGRTPIPLPHKPIPLPPKPTLGGNTSTGSPPSSLSKHRRK